MDDKKIIEFGKKELDPAKEEAYRKKIADAKTGVNSLKSSTPLGHVARPNIPNLSGTKTESEIPGLSPEGGVAPRPAGSPPVRQSTLDQIQKMGQAILQSSSEDTKKKEEDSRIEEEARKQLEEEYEQYDLGPKNEAELILANQKRRKEIESRCEDMSIEDLILRGEVRQSVPIIPNKFVVTFRSTLPEESLFTKRKIADGKSVSDQHTLERYALLNLCCCLVQLNGEVFPNHLDESGTPDPVLFEKKYARMMKLSGYVINDLVINLRWFDIRVRKLLDSDKLGNG